MANYEDIFKGENDLCEESLFGWRGLPNKIIILVETV